ncbi:hypothetical protein [Halopseudomonas sabulinigri]|uniref:Uncharacterized protein n=1 Tax=Halopseudomonas sabulinigri TaxID=472181 RepID=A0ABP9ZPW2_9GAMM
MTDSPTPDATTAPVEAASQTAKALPGLGSLFSAAATAHARAGAAPSKGKAGGDRHEKKIGMAPRNTRRSMGKR